MERTVQWNGGSITYTLERKKVKNINLRVRDDGTVWVSANIKVPFSYIDDMVEKNGEKILCAMERIKERREREAGEKEYTKDDAAPMLEAVVARMYPPFQKYGVPYPTVRIRKMKSRWGSCIPSKGVITLNSRLMNYGEDVMEYVAVHELCHFLEPNHSPRFYERMTEMMPHWRERKAKLGRGLPETE